MFFFDTTFESVPQPATKRRQDLQNHIFASKSTQKVTHKLTHTSSPCSHRNMSRGFWGLLDGSRSFHTAGRGRIQQCSRTRQSLSNHPSRSPPHKPSLATEQTIASIYPSDEKAALSVHACADIFFVLLHMFLFVF